MKILSIILLIVCAVSFISAEPAIGVFCGILGVAFLFLSGTTKKDSTPPAKKPSPKAPRKTPAPDFPVPGAPAVDAYAYGGSQKDYFYYLLSRAFPGYAVQVDVSIADLSGSSFHTMETVTDFDSDVTLDEASVPISFLLCRDGQPRLGILLGGRDDRSTAPYRATEEKLVSMGIPVQYYINTFRNKASYVYDRVKKALD